MLMRKTYELPLEQIYPNPQQPRKVFSDEELNELSSSIMKYGVIQPVIVKRDKNGKYMLIAGERRIKAAAMAGLTKVPAVVRDFDERDVALIALVENVQRADLSYMEEAEAYKRLIDNYHLTQAEIAQRIGKKQSTVSNKMRLLALPEDIRKALADNHLSERHARALLRLPDDQIRKVIMDRIIKHGLNVRQSDKLIDDYFRKKEQEQIKSNKISFISYKIYLNSIRRAFGEILEVEKGARYDQTDMGDHFEIKITIPKNSEKTLRAAD